MCACPYKSSRRSENSYGVLHSDSSGSHAIPQCKPFTEILSERSPENGSNACVYSMSAILKM